MTKFMIQPKCSPEKVFDVAGARINEGTNIHIWDFGQGIHQYFKFKEAGDGYYFIEACHCSEKVLDVSCGKAQNGTNIQLWKKNYTDAQKFRLIEEEDGYVRFLSKLNEDFCIDTQYQGKGNGTNIWLYKYSENERDADAQKFDIINSLHGAIMYAKKYSEGIRNSSYTNYDGKGGNCANFCSQCLVAGGVTKDNIWKNDSQAFINTLSLKNYFCNNRKIQFIEAPNINDIDPGDIALISGAVGRFGHGLFIIGKNQDNVIYCCNSEDVCEGEKNIKNIQGVLKTSYLLN